MKILSIMLKYNDHRESEEITKLVIKQASRIYRLEKDDL